MGNQLYTLYEINIERLSLHFQGGSEMSFPKALSSGRANYIIFEELVRHFTGLTATRGSDHKDAAGKTYEQKAYEDPVKYPRSKDLFRCSASSTFAANNNGPKIKKMLSAGDYSGALDLCCTTGYDKNDFYVFTNSGKFDTSVPFRYLIIPKSDVLSLLDKGDPRLISRSQLLGMVKAEVVLV